MVSEPLSEHMVADLMEKDMLHYELAQVVAIPMCDEARSDPFRLHAKG